MDRKSRAYAGPWIQGAGAALLFLLAFSLAFSLALPEDVLLSAVRPALAAKGYGVAAGKARFSFPLAIRMDNVTLTPAGNGTPLRLDAVKAGFDGIALFRGVPAFVRMTRGAARIELYLGPRFWKPSRGEIRAAGVPSTELPGLASEDAPRFLLTEAKVRWSGAAAAALAGGGEASFESLRFPIPDPQSPVREADLRNVRMRFTLRGDTVVISPLTARFEGSDVEGTGEITRLLSPGASSISFQLRIRNPFEGRVGTLFGMVAKNAKSATLRVNGPLLSPRGEMLLF